jgi:repressor LexA
LDELTDRQRHVLEYISTYIGRCSYPPTIREIQANFGLKSTKGVKDHIDRLVEKGFLRRVEGAARALEVVNPRQAPSAVSVPLVGRVAAGVPLLAEENIQEFMALPGRLARSEGMFLLRVSGDSMKDAAILDGDMVLVRPQPFVEQGQIAVVLIGCEATVKRFYRRGSLIELRPENADFQPIICSETDDEVRVLGRVAAVFRELE